MIPAMIDSKYLLNKNGIVELPTFADSVLLNYDRIRRSIEDNTQPGSVS